MQITATRAILLSTTSYASGQAYTVADQLGHWLIKKRWATGTPTGQTGVQMLQDWQEGTTRYLAGQSYTVANPLGDFLVYQGLATQTLIGGVPVGISLSSSTVLDNATAGTVVGTITVTMSDGSLFTGPLGFGSPNNDDGGRFALSSTSLVVGLTALPAGASTQNVTVTANQNGTTLPVNFAITVNDHTVTAITSMGILSTPSNPGSGGAQSNVLVSHGLPFKKGQIPAGFVPRVFARGGAQLTNQASTTSASGRTGR
jgi:hypothetical protein